MEKRCPSIPSGGPPAGFGHVLSLEPSAWPGEGHVPIGSGMGLCCALCGMKVWEGWILQ